METYQRDVVDLEALNGLKEVCKLELWQDNDLVTAPCRRVSHHHQAVDMAEGKQAELHLGIDTIFLSAHVLKEAILHCVGNDVLV
jgi:hypothetical protein